MSSGFRGIFTIAVGLVIILTLSLSLRSFFAPPPPIIEVTNISLEPSTINVNQIAVLSIEIKSNDKSDSHFLRIEFESHTLVTFQLGNQNLPRESGKWYFTSIVNPTQKTNQPFNVRAQLEYGIAHLAYQILVKLYVDGNQFDSKALELSVTT